MAEWIEVTAPNVDAAKERALDLLGITIDEVEVEVVNEESKQLFGLRRTDARIRARVLPRTPPSKEDGRGRSGRRGRNGRNRGRRSGSGTAGAAEAGNAGGDGSTTSSRRRQATERSDRRDARNEDSAGGEPATGGPAGPDATPAPGTTTAGTPARRRSRRPSQRTRASRPTGPETSATDGAAADQRSEEPDRGGDGSDPRRRDRNRGEHRPEPTRRRRVDPATRINTRIDADTTTEHSDAQEAEMDSDVTTTYQEQAETVGEFLGGVLETFGLEGRVVVGTVEDEEVEIDVVGDDLGLLIGPRGQTMTALHELAKTVLQRTAASGPRVRLRLDVGGYRQKRREALSQFVRTQAAEVLASGEARALEPMNAADRKVVHDTINEIDGISTESEGEEPRRRVVLVPA